MTPDFSFSTADFCGVYSERSKAQGAAYYQAIGVPREATEDRRLASRYNLEFFGAPHAALLFMPSFGDDVRVAGDIGMYGQTFLLSLTAHGLGGIPQTMLGFYADTIREMLGIDPSLKMLFGISFGYPDKTDMNKRLTLYCKTGGRASLATKTLTDLGFTNVVVADMKIEDWGKAGYPLAK